MNKVTAVGFLAGEQHITLFLADREPMQLPQDGWRTKDVIEKITPSLTLNTPIEIDLDEFSLAKKIEEIAGAAVTGVTEQNGAVTLHQGAVAIPAEALNMHIARAAEDGSKGFRNFLKKFEVIKRRYTKDELIVFLKDADLPFTDDGSILGFKVLRDAGDGYMVDHHSGKVRQRLGSLVFMPESKVDQSRALCSTGLHIAARNYIGGFWYGTSRLCLVKIQPKDVVSVPVNESSKMRVSAYHIVKVFSEEDGKKIAKGTAIHDLPDALRLLEEAVAGNIGRILETVEVRGEGDIKVSRLGTRPEHKPRKLRSKVTRAVMARIVSPAQINAVKKLVKLGKNVEKWTPEYTKKMAQAQILYDKGESLRRIADKLGIDRDSMTANLDRRPRRRKVA